MNLVQPPGHFVSLHFQSVMQLAQADMPHAEQDMGLMRTFLQRQHKSSLMVLSVSFSMPSVCSKSMFDLTIVLALLNGTLPVASLA